MAVLAEVKAGVPSHVTADLDAPVRLTAGELRTRGYYLGSNVSYNLKKLVELGFIDHQKSASDKRAVRISLTPEGLAIAETVAELYDRHIVSIDKVGGLGEQEFQKMNRSLQRLDLHALPVSGHRLHALCHRRHHHPQRPPLVLIWCKGDRLLCTPNELR